MFQIKGDTRQLEAFVRKLSAAGSDLGELSESLASEAENLTKDSFRAQKDPYGQRWAPRRSESRRSSGKQILVASGVLKGSINSKSSASQFSVGYSQQYGTYHQSGTSKMVQRMMVPDAGRGLPSSWAREFKAVVSDFFEELFG